jgi:THAP4-like, heme-binding beta-barrel domain
VAPDLHPDLEALAPLLGTWQGSGSGDYPTIEPFDYLEEVTFSHVGKPFLVYAQKTKAATDGRPLHAETGYLRVPRPGHVEMVLAHPNGITEIEVGTYTSDGTAIEIDMATTQIGLTPTAKQVTALGRRLRVDGDELSYSLQMGAVGQSLQHHLSAVLHRKD